MLVAAIVPVEAPSTRFSSSVTQAMSPWIATASLVRMNWFRPGPPRIRRQESSTTGQVRRIGQPGWVHTTRSLCSQTARMASMSRRSWAS